MTTAATCQAGTEAIRVGAMLERLTAVGGLMENVAAVRVLMWSNGSATTSNEIYDNIALLIHLLTDGCNSRIQKNIMRYR